MEKHLTILVNAQLQVGNKYDGLTRNGICNKFRVMQIMQGGT